MHNWTNWNCKKKKKMCFVWINLGDFNTQLCRSDRFMIFILIIEPIYNIEDPTQHDIFLWGSWYVSYFDIMHHANGKITIYTRFVLLLNVMPHVHGNRNIICFLCIICFLLYVCFLSIYRIKKLEYNLFFSKFIKY